MVDAIKEHVVPQFVQVQCQHSLLNRSSFRVSMVDQEILPVHSYTQSLCLQHSELTDRFATRSAVQTLKRQPCKFVWCADITIAITTALA